MCLTKSGFTVSSFLFVRGQIIQSYKTGNILCNLLSGNSSHSDCHSCNIYLLARDFKFKTSPTRTSLAAESAAELPPMPTWPGTQTNTISFLYLVKFIYNCRICTKMGWPNFKLNIAFRDDRESDSIKNVFLSNNRHVLELKE